MKSFFLVITLLMSASIAQASYIQCTFEHGETASYNENSQRLVIVDPHTSHPKIETLVFTKVKMDPDGKKGSDKKENKIQLIDAKGKTILELNREKIENTETGKMAEFKGAWDVGFGKLTGACSLGK